MEASKVELCKEKSFIHERDAYYTFFSLNPADQVNYNTFRKERDHRNSVVKGLSNDEREEIEKKLENMFIELVNPYLNKIGVTANRCSSFYGGCKETLVDTPRYILFEDKKPFDISIGATYWFSTKDDDLSCTSKLEYYSNDSRVESHLVYDLLERTIEGIAQDGIKFPTLKFCGFLEFASSDFTIPLIKLIHDIIDKIGAEKLEEMRVLRSEYMRQSQRENPTLEKVLKEAYERKLEIGLINSGFVEQKLRVVK